MIRQLFRLVVVLSFTGWKGAQPVIGKSVKAGTGGDSIHTVRESVSPPQLLPLIKRMVYTPGVLKLTPRLVLPVVHELGS